MPDTAPRISLIHATPVAIAPIQEAFERLWPEAVAYSLLDDSLAPDLARTGTLDQAMIKRFERLARYAADSGADAILFTCSAFGAAIDNAARSLAPLPILKPNEAMFSAALEHGNTIALVATFPPSIPSMQTEFDAMAARAGRKVELHTVLAEGALDALKRGDQQAHDRLIAEAAQSARNVDAIMLAQFSMASAQQATTAICSAPVLTSPDSAVMCLRRTV